MEIAHLDNLDNIYVVKFKRLAGELQQFKEVSGKVL
jgi:Kinase associated domain 1